MEDGKWFVGKDNTIVSAANQAAQDKLIAKLETSNFKLFNEYYVVRVAKTEHFHPLERFNPFTFEPNIGLKLA